MDFPKGDADTYFEPIIFKSVYCCVEETLKQPMRTHEWEKALLNSLMSY